MNPDRPSGIDGASAQRTNRHLRDGPGLCSRRGVILVASMSIKVRYQDGMFRPLKHVQGLRPDQTYTVFSDEELGEIREILAWLKAAEQSFEFWNNADGDIYDTL